VAVAAEELQCQADTACVTSARTLNAGMFGQPHHAAVRGHGSSPALGDGCRVPSAPEDELSGCAWHKGSQDGEKLKQSPAQVVLCCGGSLQGWNRVEESQPEQVKPHRSLFCMGLVWFACKRQDCRACIKHEGRIVFIRCLLAFRSVTQC